MKLSTELAVIAAASYLLPAGLVYSALTLENNHADVPARHFLTLDVLPKRLPAAVGRAALASVSVEYDYPLQVTSSQRQLTQASHNDPAFASGFRIARDTYISAGHIVQTPLNRPEPFVNYCPDLIVSGPSVKPTETISVVVGKSRELYGTNMNQTKHYGSFLKGDTSSVPDIAIIQAKDKSKSLPGQATLSAAKSPVRLDEPVFFVNYQPVSKKEFRSPAESMAAALNNSPIPSDNVTTPAIYGGVISGKASNGDIEVVTGLKSYDQAGDIAIKEGSSGGAVLNASGNLIGESIALYPQEKKRLLEEQFGFRLKPSKNIGNLTMALIQPINRRLLTSLKEKLAKAKACVN